MTTHSHTNRRLPVIEIAVLADDQELRQVCERLCSALDFGTDHDPPALPASMSWYDGADLPRSVQGELLAEIESGDEDVDTPSGPTGWARRAVC
jgi:hypothetical protein